MSRIGWTSVAVLGLLALQSAKGQQDGILMLDEVSITGEVREPAVAIISSRLMPEIQGFRLEKSFFDQARAPGDELTSLEEDIGQSERIRDPESMFSRIRVLQAAAWPLKAGDAAADQKVAAGEGESGKREE